MEEKNATRKERTARKHRFITSHEPAFPDGIFHVKCNQKNAKFEINLLDFSEILGISCGHLISRGVSELWLSKVLSFPHIRKNSHAHISGDINAMTMEQVSLESS